MKIGGTNNEKITCAVLTILSTCAFIKATYANDEGFGFDDLEAVEASEQQTLSQMAKEAANNYDFSKALSKLKPKPVKPIFHH